MKELYLNNMLVDLPQNDEPIALQSAVFMLGEVENRKASISNTIVLPWSERNRRILEFIDITAINTNNPYIKLRAKLLQNGKELISFGSAEIVQADEKGIKVIVYNTIIDFFEYIGQKSLSALDLSIYNHPYTIESIRSSQLNTEGYKYPFIAYGQLPLFAEDVSTKYLSVKLFRPAFFVKTLFHQIITQAGYTYEGNFLEEQTFVREIIPFSNDTFSLPKDYDFDHFAGLARSNQAVSFSDWLWDSRPALNLQVIDVDNANSFLANVDGTQYVAQANIQVKVTFRFNIVYKGNDWGDFGAPTIRLGIQKSDPNYTGMGPGGRVGDPGWPFIATKGYFPKDKGVEYRENEQTITADVFLKEGDAVRLRINGKQTGFALDVTIDSGYSMEVIAVERELIYGETVDIAANLPEINQKDFIKDILQRYCLAPIVQTSEKHIVFKDFNELYARKTDPYIWDNKKVNDRPQISFKISDKYGQTSKAVFKDDDAVQEGLGAGTLIIRNENLIPEATIITSVFAASETVLAYGNSISSINKIENPDHENDEYKFSIKTQPRILLDRLVFDPTLLLRNGDQLENPESGGLFSMPLFSSSDDFDMTLSYEYFLNNYYFQFKRMLVDSRIVRQYYLLNESDIADLDHFRPLYDTESGQNFYINSVDEYIEGEPCQVQLIRM
ncbi:MULTISPECIES: hypothetical protein [Olivibacter]|uniref:Uncharacterized protein n=1 Tax=Olivibacter jilunii TaxID=985016 RepID=A0ABW6AWN4_9SPHI